MILLKAFDPWHSAQAREWRNDPRVWKWCRQNDFISTIDQEAWFKRQADDPSIKMYAVVKSEGVPVHTDKLVGVAGLTSIDWMSRRAEFSLYIGPDYQRLGYGRKAMELLLNHGFVNLGLHNIWGESFDGNPAMELFDDIGFKREGVRRQFYWKDGKFIDAHLFSILASEYLGRVSSRDSIHRGETAPKRYHPHDGPFLPEVHVRNQTEADT